MNFIYTYVCAGLRVPGDQRQITSALPMHLVDVLPVGDSPQTFADASGMRYHFFSLEHELESSFIVDILMLIRWESICYRHVYEEYSSPVIKQHEQSGNSAAGYMIKFQVK